MTKFIITHNMDVQVVEEMEFSSVDEMREYVSQAAIDYQVEYCAENYIDLEETEYDVMEDYSEYNITVEWKGHKQILTGSVYSELVDVAANSIMFKLESGEMLEVVPAPGEGVNLAVSRRLIEEFREEWIAEIDAGNEQDENGEWVFPTLAEMTEMDVEEFLWDKAADFPVVVL